ncbi:Utp5p [Sporobolomyces salmoneus]|uniref:Utp5p n=1 Tax=Sporobolomyces salmoneus TaxID=183962 RepID=UPI00317772C0
MGKKTPKSTPRTTVINPATVATVLTSFSPSSSTTLNSSSATYYAHLHCAPDAHTLRVYEVDSGKCISRWASNGAGEESSAGGEEEQRVRSLEWCWLPAAGSSEGSEVGQDSSKRGKKRRKSDGGSAAIDSPLKASQPASPKLTIALGLDNGSILLWDPRGVAPARTLHHATSNSPVTSLSSPVSTSIAQDGHLWSAHQDGSVRLWDLGSAQLVGKVSGLTEEKRWDDLIVRYDDGEDSKRTAKVVLSHLSLHVYSVQMGSSKKQDKVRDLKATEIGRCTGHVEPAKIRWTGAASDSILSSVDELTFLSFTSSDRFVQVWSIPSSPSSSPANGTLVARLALDSGVSSASVSPLNLASQTLAAIDTVTGSVSLALLPLDLAPQPTSSPKKGKKNAATSVVALETITEISSPSQGSKGEAGVSEVTFREGEDGKAVVCRGGIKPVFEVISFRDEEGSIVKKVELSRSVNGSLLVGSVAEASSSVPQPTRYSEHTSSSVAATSANPDAAVDSYAEEEAINSGELDVDMAEPTLADRLKAMNVSQKKERRKAALAAKKASIGGGDDVEVASESSGSEDIDDSDEEEEDDDDEAVSRVPATTLTTTLVQALHSSDAPLLESCLTHSNPVLVRSTVKRLPSGSLVLSLLEALVERLGKEKRGKEGMASVKRGRALVGWLRETLIVHVGFLVTIPSLVNRLASLHASLTQRLALQPALLALNGRLELVMSQIDMRQDRPTPSTQLPSNGKKSTKAKRYVEGESDDEEGEIEDVVLGPAGGEFDDDEDLEDLDEDDLDSAFEDEEDGAGSSKPRRKVNGVSSLLDLEASEDEDFDDDEVDEEDFDGIDEDDLEDGEESE